MAIQLLAIMEYGKLGISHIKNHYRFLLHFKACIGHWEGVVSALLLIFIHLGRRATLAAICLPEARQLKYLACEQGASQSMHSMESR